jgi:ABC-2 type transport system ATP-binding protein
MKDKFSPTLALSHRAKLLILDEPTSGLDPVSRDELLDAFRFLKDRGVAILFSTHITSDLEKCADDITYISKGKLIASESLKSFMDKCRENGVGDTLEDIMIHYEKESLYEKIAE